MAPDTDLLVERVYEIDVHVPIKVLDRRITEATAAAYVRQAIADADDATLAAMIDMNTVDPGEEHLIHQDDVDNADYPPCLACGNLAPCDCTDEDVARALEGKDGA